MLPTNADLRVTETSWKKLQSLMPSPIDLDRVAMIRAHDAESLATSNLEQLIADLGLNGEGLDEYPAELHPYCGAGLRIWQYPSQFAPYLRDLAALGIRSYIEIGIRHGGTFVATVEFLGRFAPLERAIGVDILPCPSFAGYRELNPRAEFVRIDTQTPAWPRFLDSVGDVDLVLIDSFHDETQCRSEFESVRGHARAIAFHDIVHDDFEGVRNVWREVKDSGAYECTEYTAQYALPRSYMGIGLAVRRDA
jgi:cephalosporin hydroxylase